MPISKAQHQILELAIANNGFFNPEASPLRGGALNKVITALQNKTFLTARTKHGYPITDAGKLILNNLNTKVSAPEPRKGSKTEKLIRMIKRKNGATNAQIQTALNWQAHSVRAVISSKLRKKMGLQVITNLNNSGYMVYKLLD